MVLKVQVVNGVVVSKGEDVNEVLTRRAPYFCLVVKPAKGEEKHVEFDSKKSKRND